MYGNINPAGKSCEIGLVFAVEYFQDNHKTSENIFKENPVIPDLFTCFPQLQTLN